jgi:hypothetical protein
MTQTRQHDQGNGVNHLTEDAHEQATNEATRTRAGLMPSAIVLEGAWYKPPAIWSAPGLPGMRAFDENYLYLCVAPNVWRMVELTNWVV